MKLLAVPGFAIVVLVQLIAPNVDAVCRMERADSACKGATPINQHEKKRTYYASFNTFIYLCCPDYTEDARCEQGAASFCQGQHYTHEAYQEQDKTSQNYTTWCCPPGDMEINYRSTQATKCRPTKCMSKQAAANAKNLCDSGLPNHVYVHHEEVSFFEIQRDECNDADGQSGVAGVAAVCCAADTKDTYMTTLFGAEPQEFPYFARVAHNCGGVIYNEQWVITASHCVVNKDEHRVWDPTLDGQDKYDENVGTVRLNLQIKDATSKNTYNVKEIHVHPESDFITQRPTGYSLNDIALLKLENKIKFGPTVKAMRIAAPGFNPFDYGNKAMFVGFGNTSTFSPSADRRKANMAIREKDKFDLRYKKYWDQLMFAGGINSGTTAPNVGQGDSGGPLLCRSKDGIAVLCGLAGFISSETGVCIEKLDAENCAPSGFVEVQHFYRWIESIAGTQENAQLMDTQHLYGQETNGAEFPGHVHITSSEGKEGCGGTLIEDDLVLTAASCVMDDNGNFKPGMYVYVGVDDLNTGGGKKLGISSNMTMPGFRKVRRPGWGGGRKKRVVSIVSEAWEAGKLSNKEIMKDPYYKNNIVLLKLKEKSGKIAANLPTMSPNTGDMAMEVAYPLKSLGTKSNGAIPLTKREFKMLDRTECQKRMDRLQGLDYNVKIDDNVVCGVEHFSGGSMCDRELGGGMYCKGSNGQYNVLCGVQVGRLCEFNIPNEFVDVNMIKSWVMTKGQNSPWPWTPLWTGKDAGFNLSKSEKFFLRTGGCLVSVEDRSGADQSLIETWETGC